MKIDNKKGFITVYVILAMLFFVVFVTTASITATRKLKLQKEANTAIFELYDENIEGIVQKEQYTIPIYTQAQFVKIADWINSNGRGTEYVFINDVAYELTDGKLEDYTFLLRTDLYFNGTSSTENGYPFIPQTTGYHEAFKKMKAKNVEYKQRHKIVLYVEKEDKDGNKIIEECLYDDTIKISNAEEFIKIGQCTDTREVLIDGYRATPNATYELEDNIELGKFLDEIYSSASTKYTAEEKEDYKGFWKRKVWFRGVLDGNGKVINGVKDLEPNGLNRYGFLFLVNGGTIKDLTIFNVQMKINISMENDSALEDGVGVISNINEGIIENCIIAKGNNQLEKNSIIIEIKDSVNANNKENKVYIGSIVGCNRNSGKIKNCSVQNFDISVKKVNTTDYTSIYVGAIVGMNSGIVNDVSIGSNYIYTERVDAVGGAVGFLRIW